jgi:carbon-monoxide dehydrogenase iron sulfur subunit
VERILVRHEVCSGCRACMVACVASHEGGFGTAPARIKVTKVEPEGLDVPAVCRRCRRPGCVAACPTSALWREEPAGIIRLRAEECIGCGACADGCPFGMVTIRPADGYPLICDLCDGDPACVKRCAPGAIRWGDEAAGPRHVRERLALLAAERSGRSAGRGKVGAVGLPDAGGQDAGAHGDSGAGGGRGDGGAAGEEDS